MASTTAGSYPPPAASVSRPLFLGSRGESPASKKQGWQKWLEWLARDECSECAATRKAEWPIPELFGELPYLLGSDAANEVGAC